MEKKLLEVEGDEMAIFSTKGVMAIIPKNKVNWVKKKLNEGCHECIDSLVESLPNFDGDGQKAEDGVMLDTDPPKRRDPNQKFYESETEPDTYQAQYLLPEVGVSAEKQSAFRKAIANLNPKNWFVDDYSKYNTRDEAYAAARQNGQTEFMYNGERFNTKMAGTPQQQLQWSGITDEQMHRGIKNQGPFQEELENRMEQNLYPIGYNDFIKRAYSAAVKNETDPRLFELEQDMVEGNLSPEIKKRYDAYRFYIGKPQKYDTFSVSKYRPGRASNPDDIYYSINDNEHASQMVDRYNETRDQYTDISSRLKITDEQADKLKQKYHLYYEDDYDTKNGVPTTKRNTVAEGLFYAMDTKKSGQDLDIYSFLEEMGDKDLARKFGRGAKDSELTESDLKKLSDYHQLADVLNNYEPKTGSVYHTDPNFIMGKYNLSKGKDPDTGREYVSYSDLWDITKYDFGKKYNVYDRIYLDELKKDKK